MATQAEKVIAKFGGARRLAALADLDPSTVYKWTYPKTKQGTAGMIPSHQLQHVLDTARKEGILITAEDLYPGRA